MTAVRTLAIATALALAGPAVAKDAPKEKPVGTLTIKETQGGFIVGGSGGKGTLHFKGKEYHFKTGSVTIGFNAGVSEVTAKGEVYGLKKIEDFPGEYAKGDAALTFGKGEAGYELRNDKGVRIVIHAKTEGLQANASGGGLKITMAK
jgi:hypothetical protein